MEPYTPIRSALQSHGMETPLRDVTIASLKEQCGCTKTFLDDPDFKYAILTAEYFDGKLAFAHEPEPFLRVMEAVLEATEKEDQEEEDLEASNEDPFKKAVRDRFINLYDENKSLLIAQPSPVHEWVIRLSAPIPYMGDSFAATPTRTPKHQVAVTRYLEGHTSELIEKYIGEGRVANPLESDNEFYYLYLAVVSLCPSEASAQKTVRGELRAQFDSVYAQYEGDLDKAWGKHRVDALKMEQPRILAMSAVPVDGAPLLRRPILRRTQEERVERPLFSRSKNGGGSGWNPVKIALLLLSSYLAYRFVVKPSYQWIRGGNSTR